MGRVRTFFHVFKNSLIPQAPYYHKLVNTKPSFSWKYFFTLIYIVNFIFICLLVVRLDSSGVFKIKESFFHELATYPNEQTIILRDGMLRSTYNRPYLFWIDLPDTKKLIAVVDTTAEPAKINEYDSLVLFTSKDIVYKKDGVIEKKPYDNRAITIDKAYVENLRTQGENIMSVLQIALFVGAVIILPLIFIGAYSLYILILGGLSHLIFSAISKKVTFGKSYQLSLHSITVPVLVDYTLCLFKPEIAGQLFIHLAVFVLTFIFILSGIYEGYLDPLTRVHRNR